MELWRPTTPKIPNVHFLPVKRAERWDGQGKSRHEERDGKKKSLKKFGQWEFIGSSWKIQQGGTRNFRRKAGSHREFWMESWDKKREVAGKMGILSCRDNLGMWENLERR